MISSYARWMRSAQMRSSSLPSAALGGLLICRIWLLSILYLK